MHESSSSISNPLVGKEEELISPSPATHEKTRLALPHKISFTLIRLAQRYGQPNVEGKRPCVAGKENDIEEKPTEESQLLPRKDSSEGFGFSSSFLFPLVCSERSESVIFRHLSFPFLFSF